MWWTESSVVTVRNWIVQSFSTGRGEKPIGVPLRSPKVKHPPREERRVFMGKTRSWEEDVWSLTAEGFGRNGLSDIQD
ncbi:hypothetical protein CQZ93_24585 [Ochrobactrum vermis]|nr:hypothetical protein CQZ93_24585 [Ochrobactrum vermis]